MINYFNAIVNAETEAHRAQAFEDWQFEISGYRAGHMSRKIIHDENGNIIRGRQNKSPSVDDSTLDIMLANPSYAALYHSTMGDLRDTENLVDKAIDALTQRLHREQNTLDEMISRTATLPDGTRVVRDKNGDVWTLDNQSVPDDIAALVEWTGTEPLREELKMQEEKMENLSTALHELRQDQLRLGEIREHLSDNDSPPSTDQLEAYREEISIIGDSAENAMTIISDHNITKSGAEMTGSVSQAAAQKINLDDLGM